MARRSLAALAATLLIAAVATVALVYNPSTISNSTGPDQRTGIAALAIDLGCSTTEDPFDCVDAAIEEVYKLQGAEALVNMVGIWRADVYPDPFPCHRVFHLIGKESVSRLSMEDVVAEITITNDSCDNGYVHGAIEGLGYGGNASSLPSALDQLCDSLSEQMFADCLHSAGHALAINHHADVHAALDGCGIFGPEARRCAAGVFMTFGRGLPGYETSGTTQWITYRDDEIPSICSEVREDYADSCWFQIWTAYGFAPDRGGPDDLEAACPMPGETGFEYCYRGVGMLLLGRSGRDPADAAGSCPVDALRRRWCAYGIAWGSGYDYYLAFRSYEGYDSPCPRFPNDLREVCSTAEQDATIEGDGL